MKLVVCWHSLSFSVFILEHNSHKQYGSPVGKDELWDTGVQSPSCVYAGLREFLTDLCSGSLALSLKRSLTEVLFGLLH